MGFGMSFIIGSKVFAKDPKFISWRAKTVTIRKSI